MRIASGNADLTVAASRAPQRARGRRRVADLMAAAAGLFVEKGFEATTMTEIAAQAGASIGSLYLFFPTKPLLAQALMAELADTLSTRLEALQALTSGQSAGAIADAVFDALAAFLADHPAYAALIDAPGDDSWKQAIRIRRRLQIGALFARAVPPLAPGQAEVLALVVPQLMRITLQTSEPQPLREAVLGELRKMLRHHLDWPLK